MNRLHSLSPWLAAVAAAALLLGGGCRSPGTKPAPANATATPNFGPPMQDVRTEARILEMELEYNAAKNSKPTYEHLAIAKKKAKEAAKAEAARKAEAEKQAAKD